MTPGASGRSTGGAARNRARRTRRACPECGSRLAERRLKDSGVKVDCCPGCRGLWFDNRELESSLEVNAPERFVPRDAIKSDRSCPGCKVLLFRFDYPGTHVEVEMCERCHGIWLDAGEMKKLEEEFSDPGSGFLRFVEGVMRGLGLSG